MFDFILDIIDILKFDIFKMSVPPLPPIDYDMQFELHRDNRGYWITSKEHPGFLASGQTMEELRTAAFETILVYYSVPRYHSKKIKDLLTLQLPDGAVVNPPEPLFSIKLRMA